MTKIPEKDYKKIVENMPICCVDLVLYHDNNVLLVKRGTEPFKGVWWLPGGRIYKNERLEEAAVRKAHEELGLKVKVVKKIGVYETMFKESNFSDIKNGVHTVNVCFLVKSLDKNPEIRVDKTISGHKWADNTEEVFVSYVKEVLSDCGFFS